MEVPFNMSLLDKLKKNTTIKDSAILSKSKFFTDKDVIPTDVPMVNVALSGSLDGGLVPGLTMLAGPSKHFKTAFALLMASSYTKKYKDAVILFYDSEFGTPQKYFETFNIDKERVLHTPITDVEQLKHDIMVQLQELGKDDKLIIILDSIGNLASKKEIGMFSREIVGGGTGSYYSADTIWILGRQQDKTAGEVSGYNFIINVEKSRFVREKSKIPVTVSFEGGIQKYSGLLDVALEGGFIQKPSNGWYSKVDQSTGELGQKYREADTHHKDFWGDLLKNEKFKEFINQKYAISYGSIMREDDVLEETEDA